MSSLPILLFHFKMPLICRLIQHKNWMMQVCDLLSRFYKGIFAILSFAGVSNYRYILVQPQHDLYKPIDI